MADFRGFPSAGFNPLGKGGQAVEESGVGVKQPLEDKSATLAVNLGGSARPC